MKIKLFITIGIIFSMSAHIFSYEYRLPNDIKATKNADTLGYIISINDNNTFLIDKGISDGIKAGYMVYIYAKDIIIKHPVTGSNISVMGKKIGEAIVKDVNNNYSVAEAIFLDNKINLQPGYKIKILSTSNKSAIKKRHRGEFKHKQETTIDTALLTGFFGKASFLNEKFSVGYKFPSNIIFNIELRLSQELYILNLYNSTLVNEYLIFGTAGAIIRLDFWRENGGLGFAGGAGFSKSGFSGNIGIILGNLNKTGLEIFFSGTFNELIMADVNFSIYVNKYLNIFSKINYTYWLNSEYIDQGLLFTIGLNLKINNIFYINLHGGITNTISSLFGGIGGFGFKAIF